MALRLCRHHVRCTLMHTHGAIVQQHHTILSIFGPLRPSDCILPIFGPLWPSDCVATYMESVGLKNGSLRPGQHQGPPHAPPSAQCLPTCTHMLGAMPLAAQVSKIVGICWCAIKCSDCGTVQIEGKRASRVAHASSALATTTHHGPAPPCTNSSCQWPHCYPIGCLGGI